MLNGLRREKCLKLITICVFLYGAVSVFMGVYRGFTGSMDFQWDSAKVLALRINPFEASMNPDKNIEQILINTGYGPLEANQFPSLLWLLYPFTLFTPHTANILWAICNVFFAALFLYGLRKTFLSDLKPLEFCFTAAVFLSGTPLRNCLAMGQHTLFSMAFLVLAIWAAQEEKHTLAGILLSISYFKYVLIVPIALYFLYKRWWKELVISVIPHILLTAFSAWWLDTSFLAMILQPLEISAQLADQGAIDLARWIGNSSAAMLIAVVLGLLLAVLVLLIPKGCDREVITLLMLVSLVLMYHRFYDFFILVVPMALILFSKKSALIKKAGVSLVVVISFYVFSIFIHIWGMEGREYELLTAVLAIIYYFLIAAQLVDVIKLIRKHMRAE